MALTILFTAIRSDNFQTLTIADNGTSWGIGGEMATGDVTAINLLLFGTDKETPLKTVTFTSEERSTFLAGGDVVLPFLDVRLWGTLYQPDNFILSQLNVDGGTTISTQVAYDSWYYLKRIVMEYISGVDVPLESTFEANKAIVGDLAAITTLEYISSIISIARENKWRKTYDFLSHNHNL